MLDKQAIPEQTGAELALRCYELNELASKVRDLFRDDLRQIRDDLGIYRFTDRLKGQENIQNKVLRRRDELGSLGDASGFHPEDVTDAWGCRYVTLFQSQIKDVMSRVFKAIEGWRAAGHALLIVGVNVYTNRPESDPISIARDAKELVEIFNTKYSVSTPYEVLPRIDSRDSGYSSIHFVLKTQIERRIGAERFTDFVSFEIQVRDIFEEAWSEVSHAVSYRDKDRLYKKGTPRNATVDIIARPQLNALKTVADGCGQLAEQIRKSYDDLRGRLSIIDPTTTYMSVVPLPQVCSRIVAQLPKQEALVEAITYAYGLLQDAHDASGKYYDTRVSMNNYRAAATKFREAIDAADDCLGITMDRDDGKTIEWYLKIEYANALLFAVPSKIAGATPEERRLHEEACNIYEALQAKFPTDPVVQLRRAQAERKAVQSSSEALAIINRLERALQAGSRKQGPTGESLLSKHQIRLELALARLDYFESTEDRSAKEEMLRKAIEDVQEVVREATPTEVMNAEMLRVHHRALSNSLWFYHRLRTTGTPPTIGPSCKETSKN